MRPKNVKLQMRRKARIFLFVTGGLLSLIVLLALFVWAFVNSGLFKSRIEDTVSRVLGMELKIEDQVRILLFPAPGLRLGTFHIRSNEAEWINASGLDLEIRLLPFLRGQVEIESIGLLEPTLQIERDSEGAYNFVPAHRPDGRGERRPLEIRHFRARDANLIFIDKTSGEEIQAQRCDWTASDFEWRPAGSNPSGLNLPDFQGQLSCRKIVYDVMEATELEAEVSVQDQQLKVSLVTATLFDGRLKARLKSDFSGSSPDHFLESELAEFRIERFMETFQQEHGAEGLLTFTMKLNYSGKTLSEMRTSLDGRAELSGTELLLYGLNLDEQLKRYRSTQRFNLVDVAAFFVAGPVGVAITRGYGFASLFVDTDQQTPIRELVSKWDIENGIARARDVALSTAENRVALAGSLDFVNLQFEDVRVAVIDAGGCAVVEQSIRGEFHDPEIEKPNFLVGLAGPLIDILERGVDLLKDTECEPFYTGQLVAP